MPKPFLWLLNKLPTVGKSRRYFRLTVLSISLVLLSFSAVFIFSDNNYKYSNQLLKQEPLKIKNVVDKRSDLINVDISEQLKFQDWSQLGIDSLVHEYNYTAELVTGLVSNINLDKIKKNYKNEQLNNNEDKLSYNINEKLLSNLYEKNVKCSDLQYNSTLEYYKSPDNFKIDFGKVRKFLIENDVNGNEFNPLEEQSWTEEEILSKRWYAFGTAPVWLETENCYVAYTRIIYSRHDDRGSPYISLAYGQAFDKDWKEIEGKRIFFRDSEMPKEIKTELENLENILNSDKCQDISVNSENYSLCIKNTEKENIKLQKKIDTLYDKYSITYPTVLKVPFAINNRWNGPEDSHVILKKDKEGEEPVVIFNMPSYSNFRSRRVRSFLPHRKNNNFVEFDIDGIDLKFIEKNWAPFFYPGAQDSGDATPGFIYFVYDFNPMEIIRCSLLSGHCTYVFKASAIDSERGGTFIFRGGTQFVPLPDVLPQVKDTRMWIGFMKGHVDDCGCGVRFYRPALSLMIEKNGIFHLELIAPNIDFNEAILGWHLKDARCIYLNVLSPSSIANWFVLSQDPKTKKFDDYLILTVSEADYISKIGYIKGLLNYILDIYNKLDINESFELSANAKNIIEKTAQCGYESSKNFCDEYGLKHKAVIYPGE